MRTCDVGVVLALPHGHEKSTIIDLSKSMQLSQVNFFV